MPLKLSKKRRIELETATKVFGVAFFVIWVVDLFSTGFFSLALRTAGSMIAIFGGTMFVFLMLSEEDES